MGYYPNNFYQNYQYGGYPQMTQSPIINNLQGKVVDGIDIVKASDVPFGSFGIFPKGDFGEIYLKTWNNNGTMQIITYKPVIETEPKEEKPNLILEKINKIENQLSDLLAKVAPSQKSPAAATESVVKKEVSQSVRKF